MDEFRTLAKLWPAGTEIDLGTDSNLLGGPATFTRNAAPFVTTDGNNQFQFLFWNTGRHLTSKKRVKWNFSVLGWGTWTATRWYGTPGAGGSGAARVRADAFRIGSDETVAETPIDGVASIIPPGAWPTAGDDHVISTVDGGATVVAKDPLNGYEFAGWLQLIWGGDPGGEFVETDAGSGGTIGGAGFYDHVVGGNFPAAQGVSADLLAAYGYHDDGGLKPFLKWWKEVFTDRGPFRIPLNVDPGPDDLIRLKILQQMLEQTKPDSRAGLDFQKLIETAPMMNRDELIRAMQSVQTSLKLGETAIQAMEGRLKQFGG